MGVRTKTRMKKRKTRKRRRKKKRKRRSGPLLNQPAAKSALTNDAGVFKRASNSIEPEADRGGIFCTRASDQTSFATRRRWSDNVGVGRHEYKKCQANLAGVFDAMLHARWRQYD